MNKETSENDSRLWIKEKPEKIPTISSVLLEGTIERTLNSKESSFFNAYHDNTRESFEMDSANCHCDFRDDDHDLRDSDNDFDVKKEENRQEIETRDFPDHCEGFEENLSHWKSKNVSISQNDIPFYDENPPPKNSDARDENNVSCHKSNDVDNEDEIDDTNWKSIVLTSDLASEIQRNERKKIKSPNACRNVSIISGVAVLILFVVLLMEINTFFSEHDNNDDSPLTPSKPKEENENSHPAIEKYDASKLLLLQECYALNGEFHTNATTSVESENNYSLVSSFETTHARLKDSMEKFFVISNVKTIMKQINTPNTPQRKALCWLAIVDKITFDGAALIERYSLITSFHSFQATSGGRVNDEWINHETHHCDWKGVGCISYMNALTNEDSYNDDYVHDDEKMKMRLVVSRLHFKHEKFVGSFPHELCNLVHLRVIDLEDNLIHGALPTEIGRLEQLIKFNLGRNKLGGQFEHQLPQEFYSLPKLETLDLRSNNLSGSIPEPLGNMGSLVKLILSGNAAINGTIPLSIGNLTNLETLSFAANSITGCIPPTFHSLKKIRTLDLRLNQMSGTLPTFIGDLNSLEFLRLNSNQMDGTLPTEIGNLGRLVGLELFANSFVQTIPSELGNLTDAAIMFFYDNDLTGDMPEEVCNLRKSIGSLKRLAADCSPQFSGRGHGQEVFCGPECCTSCDGPFNF